MVKISLVFILLLLYFEVYSQPEHNSLNVAGAKTYFLSGFETGDVSEWTGDGGGNHTGGSYVSDEKPRTGRYSWKAYNNPALQAPDNISAKLLRWRIDKTEAYYSAWCYWPEDYSVKGKDGEYINFFQFKTDSPNPCDPVWVVAVKNGSAATRFDDEIVLHEAYPVKTQAIHRNENGVSLPKGKWFNIEAYYRCSHTKGQIIVWLDGKEIFNFDNVNTLGHEKNPSFVMWGIGNYGGAGLDKYIYFDDVLVSDQRINQ